MNLNIYTIMKYFKYTLYIVLLAMVSIACEVDSSKFPVDTEELRNSENTGGFLRVIDTETSGTTFDLLNLGTQEFVLTLEADDSEQGDQLESVEFFVGFQDNSVQTAGGDIPRGEDPDPTLSDPIRTVPASEFTVNEDSGLPRASISFSSQELLGALGLTESDVGVGSAIRVRWTLNLENGQSFNDENSGSNITGGAFYNSPFAENISQAVALPDGAFTGTYMFEQNAVATGGVIGGFGDGILFGSSLTGTVEVEEDPDNPLNGRVFDPDEGGYLDAIGFGLALGPFRTAFTLDPATGTSFTTLVGTYGTGLACASGIILSAPELVSAEGSYDATDDSQFTLTIVDDFTNDCGFGAFPIEFTFTKQ